MEKQNNTIWLIVGVVVAVAILLIGPKLGLFVISGNSMTRDVPSIVSPGQQFNVIYTASASGNWGASIIDSVNGGCKFPDGSNQLKSVMLSTDGNSKTIKVEAPSSGSCTFSGDYQFGTEAIKNFASDTITTGNGGCETDEDCKEFAKVVCDDGSLWYHGYSCDNVICVISLDIPPESCIKTNGNGGIDWNQVIFSIGDFEVTLKILLISLGGLLLLLIISKK